MRKFLLSPLFRCLICLILISCILVNCSPIRADAFGAGAAVTAIVGAAAAASVVAGVMVALGVMPDSTNTGAFNTVVNECVDALSASGAIVGGMITLLQLSDGVVTKNHVNQGIVEAILDWLFSSGTVSVDKGIASAGWMYYNGVLAPEIPMQGLQQFVSSTKDSFSNVILCESYGQASDYSYYFQGYHVMYCNTLHAYYPDANTPAAGYFKCNAPYLVLKYDDNGVWSTSTYTNYGSNKELYRLVPVWSNVDVYDSNNNLVLASSAPTSAFVDTTIATGLIAGQIGTDIETDYETWVQDGVVAVDFGIGYVDDPNTENDDDDDEDGDTEIGPSNPKDPVTPENPAQPSTSPSPWWKNNKWLNVGGGIAGAALGELTYQLLNQTQNGIQTGSGDPAQKVDTSLFGNNGGGTNNWTGSDPSVPSDPDNPDVPTPVPDIAPYALDLKDFFPFCIPFDIYDFFSALIAPPEAPVFIWELKDLSGRTYPIVVDLSCWDQLAEVFRSMQLLLFIVGLAVASRKFIKW